MLTPDHLFAAVAQYLAESFEPAALGFAIATLARTAGVSSPAAAR